MRERHVLKNYYKLPISTSMQDYTSLKAGSHFCQKCPSWLSPSNVNHTDGNTDALGDVGIVIGQVWPCQSFPSSTLYERRSEGYIFVSIAIPCFTFVFVRSWLAFFFSYLWLLLDKEFKIFYTLLSIIVMTMRTGILKRLERQVLINNIFKTTCI